MKITAGSAGTALVGTLSDRGYHAAVGASVALAALAGAAATLHRRRTDQASHPAADGLPRAQR